MIRLEMKNFNTQKIDTNLKKTLHSSSREIGAMYKLKFTATEN